MPSSLTFSYIYFKKKAQGAVKFNASTNSFDSLSGVDTVDFGGWEGLVYGPVVKAAYEELGYTAGVNLFAAPFDWRFPSTGLSDRGGIDTLLQPRSSVCVLT